MSAQDDGPPHLAGPRPPPSRATAHQAEPEVNTLYTIIIIHNDYTTNTVMIVYAYILPPSPPRATAYQRRTRSKERNEETITRGSEETLTEAIARNNN